MEQLNSPLDHWFYKERYEYWQESLKNQNQVYSLRYFTLTNTAMSWSHVFDPIKKELAERLNNSPDENTFLMLQSDFEVRLTKAYNSHEKAKAVVKSIMDEVNKSEMCATQNLIKLFEDLALKELTCVFMGIASARYLALFPINK